MPTDPDDDTSVTAAEAARLVGRRLKTIYAWCGRGLLAPVGRVGGVTYYRPSDVKRVAARLDADPRTAGGFAGVRARAANRGEPTAAEVERTVAEQMRCLPPWWWSEVERRNGREFAESARAEYEAKRRDAA